MQSRLPENSGFTKETQEDLYALYNEGAEVSDFIRKIVPERKSLNKIVIK